jgi:hypothetical protein
VFESIVLTRRPAGFRRRLRPRRARASLLPAALALLVVAALGGCGHSSGSEKSSAKAQRAALSGYLKQVEPIRLAVNRLLNGADPILRDNHEKTITPQQASLRMGALERRFAGYSVDVAAITPTTTRLRSLHAIYAHTFILEDSYLSALVTGLAEGDTGDLPNTQSEQRAAIIQWRTGLEVLARQAGFKLPADLQVAGRGEIAPSPDGS